MAARMHYSVGAVFSFGTVTMGMLGVHCEARSMRDIAWPFAICRTCGLQSQDGIALR